MDRDTIFRSNWSYRGEAAALLPIGPADTFPIDQCTECGFVYAGLLPDASFLTTIYDSVIDAEAARADNLGAASLAARMAGLGRLLKLLDGVQPTQRVLDFGCGFGPTLQLLNALPSVRALGYETSETRLQDLRARGLAATGSADDALRHGPFDAVIVDNVLEHVPDPRETLSFIGRAAAASAILYVSVPDAGAHRIASSTGVHTVPMDINPWEHLNYFDLPHLDRLVGEAGFLPCRSWELAGPVDVGVRPLAGPLARFRNALGSLRRLAGYVARGDANPSVTGRFYRRMG